MPSTGGADRQRPTGRRTTGVNRPRSTDRRRRAWPRRAGRPRRGSARPAASRQPGEVVGRRRRRRPSTSSGPPGTPSTTTMSHGPSTVSAGQVKHSPTPSTRVVAQPGPIGVGRHAAQVGERGDPLRRGVRRPRRRRPRTGRRARRGRWRPPRGRASRARSSRSSTPACRTTTLPPSRSISSSSAGTLTRRSTDRAGVGEPGGERGGRAVDARECRRPSGSIGGAVGSSAVMPSACLHLQGRLEGDLARHHRAVADLLRGPVGDQRDLAALLEQAERQRGAGRAGADDGDPARWGHASQRLTHGRRRARPATAAEAGVDQVEVVGAGELAVVEPVEARPRARGCSAPGPVVVASPCTTTTSAGTVAHPGGRGRRRRTPSGTCVGGAAEEVDRRRPSPIPCSARRAQVADRRQRHDPVGGSAGSPATAPGGRRPSARPAWSWSSRRRARRAAPGARRARRRRRRGGRPAAVRRRPGGTPATRRRTRSAASALASGRACSRSYSCRQKPPCT